mmetsp:Transcript_88710/g.286636  ORF Transcript_88710/g.286636 Transcript_88710/m.286636 type:complete len:290 (+) Transcript_88710:448-1317(+)
MRLLQCLLTLLNQLRTEALEEFGDDLPKAARRILSHIQSCPQGQDTGVLVVQRRRLLALLSACVTLMAGLVEIRLLHQHQPLQRDQHLQHRGALRIPRWTRPCAQQTEANLPVDVQIRVQALVAHVVGMKESTGRSPRILRRQCEVKEKWHIRIGCARRPDHHGSEQIAAGAESANDNRRRYAFRALEQTLFEHNHLSPDCNHQRTSARGLLLEEVVVEWLHILSAHVEWQDFGCRRSRRRGRRRRRAADDFVGFLLRAAALHGCHRQRGRQLCWGIGPCLIGRLGACT